MESLVDEKVDAFWKGVDGGVSKSGQIIVTFSEKKPKKTTWFQVYAGEVRFLIPPAPWLLLSFLTGRDSMGAMVLWFPQAMPIVSSILMFLQGYQRRNTTAKVRSRCVLPLATRTRGCLTITRGSPDRQAFDANLTSTLTNSLRTMLTHTSSERGRMAVPLITEAQSISPFPIKMVVKVGGVDVG